MKQLNRIIRKVDLFGVELGLNIKQEDKYRSTCSGLLTLAMVALLCYIFIIKFISVINRENYALKVQSHYSKDPNYSIMDSDNFMMAVKITDPFTTMYPNQNKTSYNVTVQQYAIKTLKNGTKVRESLQSYKLETCTDQHFKRVDFENQEQIKSQLSSYLCFPINYELFLQGNYNSETFYYPKLQVQICTAEVCYSQNERTHVISNTSTVLTISTLIQSSIFLSNKTEDFLYQYIVSDFYLTASFSTSTTADLFFKQTKVYIDNTLISFLGKSDEDDFWSYDVLNYRQFQNPVSQPDILFQMNIRLNPEQEIITKTADKLDLLISYFGGMLKFFTAIFGIIAIRYNSIAMKLSLANSLYQFNIPTQMKNGEVEFSYDKLLNYIQIQINRVDDLIIKLKTHAFQVVKMGNITKAWGNLSNSFRKSQIQDSPKVEYESKISQNDLDIYTTKLIECKENFLSSLIQKILDTRNQLRLGINFIIYLLMCCQCSHKIKMKRQLLTQCNIMIQRDLDIVNILTKIQQIDKLKNVLLDEDQIRVFNYTPKPIVNIDKRYKVIPQAQQEPHELISKANKQKRFRIIQKRVRYNKPQQFLKTYESYLMLKPNNCEINQRLIEMLGGTLEMIFQKYHEIQILSNKKGQLSAAKSIIEGRLSPNYEQDALISNKGNSPSKICSQIPPKTLSDEVDIQFNEDQI